MPIFREHCGFEQFSLLHVPISLVNLPRAAEVVVSWAQEPEPKTVFVREVASLMAAVGNKALLNLHYDASLIVPDGMPLVWAAKMKGLGQNIGRVAGADLVDAVCSASSQTPLKHYFFGGKPGVAEKMAQRLCENYPGLSVAGTYSPPMRYIDENFELGDAEIAEIEAIRQSGADVIWIGISSPKQEYWMMKAAPLLGRGVFLGVGAAFDFQAGSVQRAPKWMRNSGLEWLHRLMSEPQRLWRRYLVLAPRFVFLALLESFGGHQRDTRR